MSIENNLKRIADSLEIIAASMQSPGATTAPAALQPAPTATEVVNAQAQALDAMTTPAPPAIQPAPAATVAPIITPEMLNEAAMAKMNEKGDNGASVIGLLGTFGVQSITQLQPTQYVDFKTKLEAL